MKAVRTFKEVGKLGKAFGLIACGSLITASMWWGNPGLTAETKQRRRTAHTDKSSAAARGLSSRALLRLGKEQYAKGHYLVRDACYQELK